jgi:hypothetical protein
MTIVWGGGKSVGKYTGTIDNNGWIQGGRTYDEKKPSNWATWWLENRPLSCI